MINVNSTWLSHQRELVALNWNPEQGEELHALFYTSTKEKERNPNCQKQVMVPKQGQTKQNHEKTHELEKPKNANPMKKKNEIVGWKLKRLPSCHS